MTWQPIETAPKNDKEILVKFKDSNFVMMAYYNHTTQQWEIVGLAGSYNGLMKKTFEEYMFKQQFSQWKEMPK